MYQEAELEGCVVTPFSGWPFPAHCTEVETKAHPELGRPTPVAMEQNRFRPWNSESTGLMCQVSPSQRGGGALLCPF